MWDGQLGAWSTGRRVCASMEEGLHGWAVG